VTEKKEKIISLDKVFPFDKIALYFHKYDSPDKAYPFVRRGRKAADAKQVEAWPSCRRIKLW
jgi:hypothetical protein